MESKLWKLFRLPKKRPKKKQGLRLRRRKKMQRKKSRRERPKNSRNNKNFRSNLKMWRSARIRIRRR